MTKPSSRTPEGIPHRCATCGRRFRITPSPTGDACCPACNTLIWPDGVESQDSAGERVPRTRHRRFKEIRLRARASARDVDVKTNRAVRFLTDGQPVRLCMVFRGREIARAETARLTLDQIVEALVPEHGTLKHPPKRQGRRIVCTIVPGQPGKRAAP